MSTPSTSAAIKNTTPQADPSYNLFKKESLSASLPGDSWDELTIALLDPCLTVEEAALEARMQQCHPRGDKSAI